MFLVYAIICSEETERKWAKALSRLQEKYEQKWPGMVGRIVYHGRQVGQSLISLRSARPAYSCFVAHYTECTADFVHQVHRLVRQIDPGPAEKLNPYGDTVWGILTGLVEEDVLFAVRQENLVVRRVFGGTEVNLRQFESGFTYNETTYTRQNKSARGVHKPESECIRDATKMIVEELSEPRNVEKENGLDFIVTGGHASPRDWKIGYVNENGKLECQDGNIMGVDIQGYIYPVKHNGSPKVYSSAGNCYMGLIDNPNCMALSWMHSVGVIQMTGYITGTWFGYMGFGVHEYFFQSGQYSFAEAFFASNQALLMHLHEEYPEHSQYNRTTRDGDVPRECLGLQFDQDNVAFYGDPAFDARLLHKPDLCDFSIVASEMYEAEMELGLNWKKMELQVVIKRKCNLQRPPLYFLPRCAEDYKLLEGSAIVTCRFILFRVRGPVEPSQCHKIVVALKFNE